MNESNAKARNSSRLLVTMLSVAAVLVWGYVAGSIVSIGEERLVEKPDNPSTEEFVSGPFPAVIEGGQFYTADFRDPFVHQEQKNSRLPKPEHVTGESALPAAKFTGPEIHFAGNINNTAVLSVDKQPTDLFSRGDTLSGAVIRHVSEGRLTVDFGTGKQTDYDNLPATRISITRNQK